MDGYLKDDEIISECDDGAGNRIEVRRWGRSKDRLAVVGFDREDNLRIGVQVRREDHTAALDHMLLGWLRTLAATHHGLKLID